MGIYQMDTRTGKIRSFKLDGAPINDTAARRKVESMVSDYGWKAENPILYSVNGEPTWVASLTLASGEYQGIALVHYEREIRAYARDKDSAISEYTRLLQDVVSNDYSESPQEEKETTLLFMTSVVMDGNSVFLLKTEDGVFSVKLSKESLDIPFLKEGDRILVVIKDGNAITVKKAQDTPVAVPASSPSGEKLEDAVPVLAP
jgi:hypothetical protein